MKDIHTHYDPSGAPCSNEVWTAALKQRHRVAWATLGDDVVVSTIYTGQDMRPFDEGAPLIYETQVFGGDHAEWANFYPTEAEALAGHAAVVAWLKGEADEPASA